MSMMMKFVTKPCPRCGKQAVLDLPEEGVRAFDNGRGAFIQDAFPELTTDERELILTGIDAECWEQMFPPDTEDDDWEDLVAATMESEKLNEDEAIEWLNGGRR